MRVVFGVIILIPMLFIGFTLAIVAGFWAGGTTSNFLVGLAAAVAVLFVMGWLSKIMLRGAVNAGRVNMTGWLNERADCEYRAAFDGDGIAVSPATRRIFLTAKLQGKRIAKAYSFDEVREWGYEVPGVRSAVPLAKSDLSTSAGLAVYNAAMLSDKADNTGFWVKVKDIDHPRWFIRFKALGVRERVVVDQLERWMEIFDQHVKAGASVSVAQPTK